MSTLLCRGQFQSGCPTELISINICEFTKWISMTWNQGRCIFWEVMAFSILRKEIFCPINRFTWEFFLNDSACVIFTTAVLGLQPKLPKGWDYLCYWAEAACSEARFCLCQVYEVQGFVKFKASLHFSKEKGFLSEKVQPLWRCLKLLGLKENIDLFLFLILTCLHVCCRNVLH